MLKKSFWRIMQLNLIFILVFCLDVSASVYSQQKNITLELNNATLEEFITELKEQTGLQFLYNSEKIKNVKNLNINIENKTLDNALRDVLSSNGLDYEYVDEVVVLINQAQAKQDQLENLKIRGKITDEQDKPLPGATIIEKETTNGTTSDVDGNYSLTVSGENSVIQISYIGFETQEIKVDAKTLINFVLKPSSSSLDEIIVTGYFKRKKESYTGTAITVTAKELKQFGNANIIQSLQVFDPSFKIVSNNEFGSDPNKMPEIVIRGKASFPDISESAIKRNQNMPTFILDGFEVNVEKIYDLDMNRVASVTILKDAAATAIYGSRASNGVVVVETKAPKTGALQITYNLNATISAPDLSDYNLMNATEKLEAERLGGLYYYDKHDTNGIKGQVIYDNFYNAKLLEIAKGVNTHWISQPLNVSFGQNHSLYLQGGDEYLRYGLDLGYNTSNGIMKGSGRDRTSIGIKLLYRYKNIQFKNYMSFSYVKSNVSPYGSFSEYTMLNPYYRLKDANGMYLQYLGGSPSVKENPPQKQFSPIYDAVYLNNRNEKSYLNLTNNFSIDWSLTSALKLKASISVSKQYDNTEIFKSPESMKFRDYKDDDLYLRGSYSIDHKKSTTIDANAVLSYFKQVEKHLINIVIGSNILETDFDSEGYTAVGFMNDRLGHVSFAKQFKENSTPNGYEELSRLVGVFSNLNYTFDNRLLVDVSARLDGSSKFGKLQRSAPFWSVGIGWNIHNEKFFTVNDKINRLKLTVNIGTTGGVEFNAYQALTTYQYISDNRYSNYPIATLKGFGNEDLKWQKTLKRNIGFDVAFFNNRFQLNANYYTNTTKDLLTDITIAPSIGFNSLKSNMGNVENKGFEASINLNLIQNKQKSFYVNLFANVRHNKNKITKLSEALKNYNDKIVEILNQEMNYEKKTGMHGLRGATPHLQFYEGESLYAIYAVRSLGIDPITGKELFVKRDGSTTYEWDAADQVNCGEAAADFEGYFGTNIDYKGFIINLSFNYQTGAQVFNRTLLSKVENAEIYYNADKRVLEERWKKPGEITFYKGIKNKLHTRTSSRFVEDENILALKSVRISYTLNDKIANKLHLSKLKFSAYMNNVFHLSTVKQERGIQYPFARTFSFSIQANF
jgi:TonB-linked SusC/RagA family outer membrane protein